MPRTATSETTKAQLVRYIESETGYKLVRKDHHTDWYHPEDGYFEVFLTYSQGSYARAPWYDMQPADIERLAAHVAGFIIFVLDDQDRSLVVPAKDLAKQLTTSSARTEDGRYMFHVNRKHNDEFQEIPGWTLPPYLNKWSQLPKKSATEPKAT